MNRTTMSTLKRSSLATSIACAYMSLALAPAYASDTEIYARAATSTVQSPSLMMMFDTSGSMGECVAQANVRPNDCTVGDNITRMTALKSAMTKILRGDAAATPQVKAAPGFVKMGFSRYRTDGGGGWVTYPARPLDAFVDINPNGNVSSDAASGASDAEQGLTPVNNSTQLVIGLNGLTNQNVGLQFTKVRVPKGAEISNAYIELTAKEAGAGVTTWKIDAQAIGDAPDFSVSPINSRSYASDESVHLPEAWVAGTRYQIPVTDALKNIVKRSDWCGDNAVALRIRDVGANTSTRKAYSFEGAAAASNPALQPKLVIEYLIDPESTNSCIKNVPRTTIIPMGNKLDDLEWTTDLTVVRDMDNNNDSLPYNNVVTTSPLKKSVVGLRFTNVAIPQGVTITNASLQMTAYPNSARTDKVYPNVETTLVSAFKQNNLPLFCTSTTQSTCITNAVVNGYALTTANTLWAPPGNQTTKDTAYVIDVTSATQEVVNLSGATPWASGNALGFRLINNGTVTNPASFYTMDKGGVAKAASLKVNWIEPVVTNLSTITTVRDDLEVALNALNTTGGTPLAAAYAEASRYMYGIAPSAQGQYVANVVSGSPTKYVSPIDDECSGNYIFLLTDGDPNGLAGADSNTQGMTGRACNTDTSLKLNSYISGTADQTDWRCMLDLARYNATTTATKRRVNTNTVIFGPLAGDSEKNMQQVANFGQGKYYKAGDEAALVNAVTETINDLLEISGTISAPGVSVNQLSRLTHLSELFYAVFEPQAKSYRWDGNLKRYKLNGTGSAIIDANGNEAVDSSTGFFKETSKSFWSASVDGAKAVEGGAASVLPAPTARKMYTYLGAMTAKNQPLIEIDTTSASFNASAKTAMGVSDDNKYKNIMNWYKGYVIPDIDNGLVTINASTGLRNRLGGILHSQPLLVSYGFATGAGVNANLPENQYNYVFVTTMEGTLHVIDARTGIEKFSFIPGKLLGTLENQINDVATDVPNFGLDLTLTYARIDGDKDGQITSADDKLYLYAGMRMGGSDYYAFNMSNLDSPKLMFTIVGGSTGFANMGQTWSQPVYTKVSLGGAEKRVLIFGGGYDPRHENANLIFTGNDKGNQLYIVDAETGSLIWSASGNSGDSPTKYVADMKYSVPTSPKVLDVDGDSLADTVYFGDLGGQVFRVDLNKSQTNAGLVKRVKLIASLGQTDNPQIADQRRFYEPPEVALYKDAAGNLFAGIATGTGYRSHPLDTFTQDRFYTLFDYDVLRKDLRTIPENDASLAAVIRNSDLGVLNLASSAGASVVGKRGWYVNLPEAGEKNLSSAVLNSSRLIFSTYVPDLSSSTTCVPVVGRTKLYSMCMPYGDICDSGVTSRVTNNVMVGLGGEPQVLYLEQSDGSVQKNVITGTNNDGGSLLSGTPNPVPSIIPSNKHNWREKTRNPAQ